MLNPSEPSADELSVTNGTTREPRRIEILVCPNRRHCPVAELARAQNPPRSKSHRLNSGESYRSNSATTQSFWGSAMQVMSNLYDGLPASLPQELTDTLLTAEHFRIERIVSCGH